MEDLHIYLYGEIGWEVTAQTVQDQLANAKDAEQIIVHISSPGGGVFEGWTIGNIIKGTGKKVVAVIEGLCASIATYPAMIADEVRMAETARFMIHNPTMFAEGDEKEMEGAAEMLSKIKADLIRAYSKKTGISDDELSTMMNAETMMTSDEAKRKGFVDEVIPPVKAVAKFNHPEKEILARIKSASRFDVPDSEKTNKQKDNTMAKETKKPEEKVDKLDTIINKATTLLNSLFKSVKNILVELKDGTKIWVESEDGEFEGKKAFTVDEEGNPTETPAPAGDHELNDGRTITIDSEGLVTAVKETEEEEEEENKEDEEMQNLKAENEALKAKVAEMEAAGNVLTVENEQLENTVRELAPTVQDLINEVNNLKSVTVGGSFKAKKVFTPPKNKFDREEKPVNGLASWGKAMAEAQGLVK